MTPEVVAAYAALSITDDYGMPIMPAAHHWLWLQLACDEHIKKLMIISPPESAKTTWLVSAFMGCRVGIFPEGNHIIASVDADTAMKRSMSIRNSIESSTWKSLFPNILSASGMKWEQGEWSLAPAGIPHPGRLHPTVRAYGTGQSIVGSRADLLLADDILDFENTRTDGGRKVTEEWFHNSFLSRRKAGAKPGRVIVIGTSWNSADLYNKIRKEDQGWVICHTPILVDQPPFYADITYPDNWPYKKLGDPLCL